MNNSPLVSIARELQDSGMFYEKKYNEIYDERVKEILKSRINPNSEKDKEILNNFEINDHGMQKLKILLCDIFMKNDPEYMLISGIMMYISKLKPVIWDNNLNNMNTERVISNYDSHLINKSPLNNNLKEKVTKLRSRNSDISKKNV